MMNLATRKAKLLILTLTACFSLTACQSMGTGASSGSVDPALENNTAKFFSKSGWGACAVGAGVGVAGCMLLGGNNKAACAAIAAVAACGILMGTNYYLEQQRGTYKNKEERLNAYIKDVRKDTEDVKAVTRSAQTVLNKNKSTLANLNRQIKDNTVSKAQASKDLAQIDANLKYLNDKLANMKKAEANWRQVASSEKSSGMRVQKLNQQIGQLNKQIAVLERQVAAVTKQRTAIKVS